MTFLSPYHRVENELTFVRPQQGSDFAKQIANDYNPIHDPESRRFCVPGDLLFSLALGKYGLYTKMHVEFLELVGGASGLKYPELDNPDQGLIIASKENGKDVLSVEYSGEHSNNEQAIEQFLRAYVAFSGHNFPHILVPLMKKNNAMINPNRPMVIYQNMNFELDTLEFDELSVSGAETNMRVDGRRGDVSLGFFLRDGDKVIGRGSKNLMLGGLREYDDAVMDQLCREYLSKIPAN